MVLKVNRLIYRIHSLNSEDIEPIFKRIKDWRSILYSTSRNNEDLISNKIKQAYELFSLPVPPIVFARGFKEAIDFICTHHHPIIHCVDYHQLRMDLSHLFLDINSRDLIYYDHKIAGYILVSEGLIFENICYGLYDKLYDLFDTLTPKLIDIDSHHVNNCYLQYCTEKNNSITYNAQAWEILKTLNQECPFLFALSEICVVIQRPIEIYLDNEQLPHAQNKPAMIFGDGYQVYYYHGISIPEHYEKISFDSWQPQWILDEIDEYNRNILIYNIGYKKFKYEFPKHDFWQDRNLLFSESIDIIINWQLYHHNQLYLKYSPTEDLQKKPDDIIKNNDSLPFKIPTELCNLYQYYNGGYQLIPDIFFYPIKQAIQALSNLNWIKSDTGYPFPLFKGNRDEIYYVLADDPEPTYSHVYCIFPGEEPIVYAECVTSLIVTIAQCYQEGAYYIAINEETGERTIEQDLDKIEPIFEKFNPDQIDTWRKIWKS
jgi:hypothetical protein